MTELPNAESVTSENIVDVVKAILESLQKVSDTSGTSNLSLMEAILDLRHEMRAGFVKIDSRLENLEKGQGEHQAKMIKTREETVDRLESLEKGPGQMQAEMIKTREETVDLLKQIAENTRKKR